jgi:hypothetical protein
MNPLYFLVAEQEARFYHPRQDRWEEHFSVNSNSCEIVSLTRIGRVTAVCLKMNSRAQVTARQFWVQIGLFP